MKNLYQDFTKNGHCSKCGECCSAFLHLSVEDIARIKKYLTCHVVKKHYHNSAVCPFLNKEKTCSIYEARPYICRIFRCNKKHPEKHVKIFEKVEFNLVNMWRLFNDGIINNARI